MINAFVSHELRNPLNSITAQNIEKRQLLKDIRKILDDDTISLEEVRMKIRPIITELEHGTTTQESASDLMKFIVQDLLDYAQIKDGKFRKSIQAFNIRDSVQRVISIQKQKADVLGLSLKATFENMADDNHDLGELISPIIHCDEQRIMQVILNLQANALKFTKTGGVNIRVSIFMENNKKFLRVAVEDTGVGISEEA